MLKMRKESFSFYVDCEDQEFELKLLSKHYPCYKSKFLYSSLPQQVREKFSNVNSFMDCFSKEENFTVDAEKGRITFYLKVLEGNDLLYHHSTIQLLLFDSSEEMQERCASAGRVDKKLVEMGKLYEEKFFKLSERLEENERFTLKLLDRIEKRKLSSRSLSIRKRIEAMEEKKISSEAGLKVEKSSFQQRMDDWKIKWSEIKPKIQEMKWIKIDEEREYQGNVQNGYGIIRWVNGPLKGQRHEGMFKDGKKHGEGLQYKEDGSWSEGVYKDDQFQKKIIHFRGGKTIERVRR